MKREVVSEIDCEAKEKFSRRIRKLTAFLVEGTENIKNPKKVIFDKNSQDIWWPWQTKI